MRIVVYFLWLIPLAALCLAVSIWGTPHIAGSYTVWNNGDPHNPRAPRRYISCTYFGLAGSFRVPARNEQCPWFRFFKEES